MKLLYEVAIDVLAFFALYGLYKLLFHVDSGTANSLGTILLILLFLDFYNRVKVGLARRLSDD